MITKIGAVPQEVVADFFDRHWSGRTMVLSSGTYDCLSLEGFADYNADEGIRGMITYDLKERMLEIISLDSQVANKGIGTKLLLMVEEEANRQMCQSIKIITTNDNLHALGFYQKRGYRCTEILVDAVNEARKIKPTIPILNNENGILIQDEWILIKPLGRLSK